MKKFTQYISEKLRISKNDKTILDNMGSFLEYADGLFKLNYLSEKDFIQNRAGANIYTLSDNINTDYDLTKVIDTIECDKPLDIIISGDIKKFGMISISHVSQNETHPFVMLVNYADGKITYITVTEKVKNFIVYQLIKNK